MSGRISRSGSTAAGNAGKPHLRYDERPEDDTPLHTDDLPATPQRDRNIPARAWIEAPDELVHLGDDIGGDEARYKRRIGRWLLWRSGPAPGPRGGSVQARAGASTPPRTGGRRGGPRAPPPPPPASVPGGAIGGRHCAGTPASPGRPPPPPPPWAPCCTRSTPGSSP